MSSTAVRFLQHPTDPALRTDADLALRQAREAHGYDALCLTDQSGRVLAAADERFVGRGYIAARWFRNAIAGNTAFDEPRYDPEDGQVYLHFSAPIHTQEDVILGTVVGRIPLAAFDRIVAADSDFSGRGDFGVLWDDLGIRLSHGQHSDLRFRPFAPLAPDVASALIAEARFGPTTGDLLKNASQQPVVVDRSRLLLYDRDADPHLYFISTAAGPVHAAIVPLRNKRWLYGIFTPEASIVAALNTQTRRALLVALAASLLAVLVALAAARWATRPVRAIAEAANAIAAGDVARRVGLRQRDEVGRLVAAFDQMTDTLAEKQMQLQRYTEEALRDARERRKELQTIINRSPAVAFLWRAAEGWPVEFVSDNVRQFGYTPEDLMSGAVPYTAIVHPDDLERMNTEIARYSEEGLEEHTQEYRLLTKSGDARWVDDRTWVRRDQDGKITYYQGIVVDITERKQAESQREAALASLRQRTAEITLLYEAGRELGRTLDVEPIYATLHRFILQTMPCDSLFVSSYDPADDLIRCLYSWGDGERFDVDQLPPIPLEPEGQGTQSLVIRTGEPLLLADYEAQRRTASTKFYVNDDGKIHEEEIPADADRPRSAIMVPLKLEGRVVGVIQVFSYRLAAYTEEDLRLLEALALHVVAAITNASLYRQVQGELAERVRAEEEVRRLNLELEQRVIARTSELQTANERLKELDRLKSQFVSNVSHELRTPLTNIKTSLYLLERGKPEKHDYYMAILHREAELLHRLIEDLLDLSRLDMGKAKLALTPADLNQLVALLCDDRARLFADHGLTLQTQLAPDLPLVMADPRMLAQVLTNLMANAMNYTPAGGTVTVRTGVQQGSRGAGEQGSGGAGEQR